MELIDEETLGRGSSHRESTYAWHAKGVAVSDFPALRGRLDEIEADTPAMSLDIVAKREGIEELGHERK